MRRPDRIAGSYLVVLAVAAAVSCAGPSVDKQGAPVSPAATVLRLGAADPADAELARFSDAVARQSGGRLAVDLDRVRYFSETPGGEARLVPDLRSGHLDLGYVPSRDWATTGDPAFRGVQSPLLLTTIDASVTLARSAAANDLLRGMLSYGVVGLGLVPLEPRRLISTAPLLSVADIHGRRIRISDSRETEKLITSFGAMPVSGLTAVQTHRALQEGALDGVETAPQYIRDNAYNVSAPYLTTFALQPKFEVIVATETAWAKLSELDRQALTAAAAETVAWAAEHLPGKEATELEQLCANGLVLVRPPPAALRAIAAAVAGSDPVDAPTRSAIEKLTAAVSGVGLQPDASQAADGCSVATTAQDARARHTSNSRSSPAPTTTAASSVLPGTYRFTVTAQQMAAAGLTGPDWSADVTFTQTFEPDGTWHETQVPDYPDQGPLSGHYLLDGDTMTITFDESPTGTPATEVVRWSFRAGTLSLTVVSVQDPASRLLYTQPWRRVA